MSSLADWRLDYQGKVRDLYIPLEELTRADAAVLLMVATDRISAFDVILDPEIPGKGAALTRISGWWMSQFPDIPNHLAGVEPPGAVADRAVVTTSLSMLPVECVVRGYLAGTGWKDYQATGAVCGIKLPEGLQEGDPLHEPLFTPATKAAVGDHDENISFDEVVALVGESLAGQLRETTLEIYRRGSAIAKARGLLLADTKLEFGLGPDPDQIVLADELLTPDSSRYWDLQRYEAEGSDRLDSFDKQPVRNWLAANWDKNGTPPKLPDWLVEETAERYLELERRLVGATSE